MLPEGELPPAEEYDSDSWESICSCQLDTYSRHLDFEVDFGEVMFYCEGDLTEDEKERIFNEIMEELEMIKSQEHPVTVEQDGSCDT